MFDVIDVSGCRAAVLGRLNSLHLELSNGIVSDSFGGRMSVMTIDEAYGAARTVIEATVAFEPSRSSRYIAQFPEIIEMELKGSTVSESVYHGLLRAIFLRIEDDIRDFVRGQYAGYALSDLDRAVTVGLVMYDRYLKDDPFGRMRIRPEKVSSYLADITPDCGLKEVKLLAGQMNNLVSELKNRAPEARNAARALREASQFCSLIVSGEAAFATHQEEALSLAC